MKFITKYLIILRLKYTAYNIGNQLKKILGRSTQFLLFHCITTTIINFKFITIIMQIATS